MGPTGEAPAASQLHGAYDDQYLLRLVSQEGKPGIFAFETCLHDQGVARQGTCVSALQNLKGEPVPISIEVIANKQLSSDETKMLAAVKQQHKQYMAALAEPLQQRRSAEIVTVGLGGPGLMMGSGMGKNYYHIRLEEVQEGINKAKYEVDYAKERLATKTDELAQTSAAFERFIVTSEAHLKNEAARLSEYLGDYNDVNKMVKLRAQNDLVDLAKVLEQYNVRGIRSSFVSSIFDQEMVKWLDEQGLPETLRKTLQTRGLSIDEYLRRPSAFDSLIADNYGNNKQAFEDIVRSSMRSWKQRDPASNDFIDPKFRQLKRHIKLGGSTLDVRGAIARFDKYRLELHSRFKTKDSYKAMLSNYELNAVRLDSYDRLRAINQLLDDVAKGVRSKELIHQGIAELMAGRYNTLEGKTLFGASQNLQAKVAGLESRVDELLRHETFVPDHYYYKPRQGVGQQGLLGMLQDMSKLKAVKIASIAALVIGFGASISTVPLMMSAADNYGDDKHEESWLALLESGQADLITDFSSSLWTPGATEHVTVPSVQELMVHITLFQRELWFGATSDAPDVVQIVKHCLPQKMYQGGGIKAACESVAGLEM